MVANNQEKQTVVQLKKAYNVFSNAFMLAQVEYGDPSGWGGSASVGNVSGSINYLNKMAPFLNLMRKCDQGKGCYAPNVLYKYSDGSNAEVFDNYPAAKAMLADGTSFYIYNISADCSSDYGEGPLKNICFDISVDVNGFNKPNIVGKDMFILHGTLDGIVPAGLPSDSQNTLDKCRINGWGCAAWVLQKENLNYPPLGVGWDDI